MNRRTLLALTAVIGLAGALGACDTKKALGCFPADDPWKHPPGSRDGINDANIKPNTVFVRVAEDKFDRTLPKLNKVRFAPLTDDDLTDLGVVAPAGTAGLSPYLMRAISSNHTTGQYLVIYMEDRVWVRFQPSDHDTCALVLHDAIVAWLPKAPLATYTTVSIVE